MTIKNLHHLGVPCKSTIRIINSERILEEIVSKYGEDFQMNSESILRIEPNGGVLTTPGLYSSFLWMDKLACNNILKGNLKNLSSDELYFLHTNEALSKRTNNKISAFNVDCDGLPSQVLFEVTSDCDCDCLACYHKKDLNSGNAPLDILLNRIDILANLGLTIFEVTGGEPFLRNDLAQILNKIHAVGRKFYVVTNGNALPNLNEELVDALKKGDGLAVSIDGYGETHDKTRRLPGLFANIEKGLDSLQGTGIPIYLISTLGEHNYEDISKLADFAKKYNSKIHLRPAIKTGSCINNDLKTKDMHILLSTYLNHPNTRNGFLATKKEIPDSKTYGCGIRKRISVDVFGRLFPCVMDRDESYKTIEDFSPKELVSQLEKTTKIHLDKNKMCTDCDVNKNEINCGGFCRFSTTYKNGTTKKL